MKQISNSENLFKLTFNEHCVALVWSWTVWEPESSFSLSVWWFNVSNCSLCLVALNPVKLLIVCDKDYEFKGLLFVWFDNIVTAFFVVCSWSAASPFVRLLHQKLHETEESVNAKRRSQEEFKDKCRNFFPTKRVMKDLQFKGGRSWNQADGICRKFLIMDFLSRRRKQEDLRGSWSSFCGFTWLQLEPKTASQIDTLFQCKQAGTPCAKKNPPTSAQIQIQFHCNPVNPTKLTTEVTTPTCWFHSGRLKQEEQEKQRLKCVRWRFH